MGKVLGDFMGYVTTWRGRSLLWVLLVATSGAVSAKEADRDKTEEIIVTGERSGQPLLRTAASVAVFDESRIAEQAGADRIEQVLDSVPNLQRGSGDVGMAIRGQDTTGVLIGANAFLGGTRPRATLQIDGRALNFNEFIYGLTPIWDVERIEVFRGPQTTTQGRNAIAGAVFIETKEPTFEFEGGARALVANYETRQASLALSGPLVDQQLAGRIAIDWREHESWMHYTDADVFSGANREDDDYTSVRSRLRFTPDAIPELDMLLTYSHLNSNNPQNETADAPYDHRIQGIQNGAQWDTDIDAFILNVDYPLMKNIQAGFTGTYTDSRIERFAPPGAGEALIKAEELAYEALLHLGPSGSRFSGLLGASYFSSDQDETSDFSAFFGLGGFVDRQYSVGVFGEARFDLASRLLMTLGGRWQQDKQDRSGSLGPVSLDYKQTFSAFLPKAEIAYDLRDDVVLGVMARKGFNPGGTTLSFVSGEVDEFDAESLWTYELFSRARLAQGDLILSGNLFVTDFTDAQRPLINIVSLPDGSTAEFVEFANAPSAESHGVEFEGVWAASPAIQVRAAIGYLKTEITETLEANDPVLGREFQRAPGLTGMLGLQLRPIEDLSLDLSARYNADYFSDDANNPAFAIESVTLVDARLAYDFGLFNTFAFVRNATDETYQVWQFRPGNSSLGDPREFGLGVEAHF